MKVGVDLDAIDAASDPRHAMVPFANRVRLTREDNPIGVYAIGRKMGEVVVEIHKEGAVYTHLLGSVISHAPDLYFAMVEECLAALPNP